MKIEFDPVKRQVTIELRGLDMARADEIFAGATLTVADDRKDYHEPRFITVGRLDGPDGRHRLDTAWRGPTHHQLEEGQ